MTREVKKPEERRQEIVSTAEQLFLNKGYEKATMADVMKQLDIAKGTIYHYFKSKEELLEEVIEQMVDRYLKQLKVTEEGSALEKMHALIRSGRVADEQAEMLERLHRPANIGMHARLLAVTVTRLAPLYAEVITQGCQEGVFTVEYPLEAAEVLLAGVQFMTDTGCYPWTDEQLARRLAALSAILETQLGAKPGSLT